MNTKKRTMTRGMLDRIKYKFLCSLMRGSSVSANPEYLEAGEPAVLSELEQDGICFLDKSGVNSKPAKGKKAKIIEIDPGDKLGRYRMVNGKQGAAQEIISLFDQEAAEKRKRR